MNPTVILPLLVSLALGLLVGFQREWTSPHVAGLRTFAFITLLGTLTALLAPHMGVAGSWMIAAGLLAVTSMLLIRYVLKFRGGDDAGLTTVMAALVMYLVGVSLVLVGMTAGVMIGGVVAVLLHWKKPMHHFVQRIGEQEIRAIIQVVLIGLVILPLLPDRAYGPYQVLNPFKIWLMVVLICGVSVAGYIVHKFLGERAGTVLGGVLGGVISSTATTVSYARRTRQIPESADIAAVVLMIASCIVFVRVLFEVAVVAPSILPRVAAPILAMMGVMVLIAAGAYVFTGRQRHQVELSGDPADLKTAMVFGVVYALVLFGVAVAKQHIGDQGLYAVAVLSGMTDMDAITLSTAKMIQSQQVDTEVGWRMIMIGAMSNLAFKAAAVGILGHRRLLGRITVLFGLSIAAGGTILAFWP